MGNIIERKVAAARAGSNPYVIGKMLSGWLLIGETQPLHGYCQLLADPVVATLNDLEGAERAQYLEDMAKAGDALLAVTGAARINYETWANQEPSLHTHLVPRYLNEPENCRTRPACTVYDYATARPFSMDLDGPFIAAMRTFLGIGPT
ncbi:HIT family protein [Gluconobacter wancherniae]|uniref:HIT domain-containing protein n=1 Tax=Gluconobacter wancherniae NBRC 103581 TaxID=656744 RepID=A0A511B272_9PROT|nr:hypothetical protein [Gluconobacter wancherniae]MBF0854639.1 hypothetical protein [Gluconobacter wancherniae]GBD57633.1 hypothetical protein NBRC103581_02223 [Gluconobacter wancherniae NBRC 103581]GBR62216.1 hypothetical protein AA103581_0195 [Gluconobacter wancherniae NBRC 103581]GEK94508.1 hypothetical protein GWA01_22780 [Gluconobacter wancherniae NBRC 103581]